MSKEFSLAYWRVYNITSVMWYEWQIEINKVQPQKSDS